MGDSRADDLWGIPRLSVVVFCGSEGAGEGSGCEAVGFETLIILVRAEVEYRNGFSLVDCVCTWYGISRVVIEGIRLLMLELGVFG
jgi:hypothetical protein